MRLFLLTATAVLLLCGCVAPARAPLDVLSYPLKEGERQPNLLVLLRGLGADHTVFASEGIVEEIRKSGLPFDVVAPDTHYGYYRTRTVVPRLKEDVVEPARRQGYRSIWLAGFSMGGIGSLFYLRDHPGDIDGILLTSPFLGWRPIHRDIRRAGGVGAWQPPVDLADEWEVMLWSWIGSYSKDTGSFPPVYLGYGSYDMVAADGPPLLASVLPAERVFTLPGNHTVSTFRQIFLRHLATLAGRTP